ncbi:hypothetical protein KKH43_05840 [Patescibacteria group bacterium]|nr:hypothetical protein [Patescibacteria group bacterium]
MTSHDYHHPPLSQTLHIPATSELLCAPDGLKMLCAACGKELDFTAGRRFRIWDLYELVGGKGEKVTEKHELHCPHCNAFLNSASLLYKYKHDSGGTSYNGAVIGRVEAEKIKENLVLVACWKLRDPCYRPTFEHCHMGEILADPQLLTLDMLIAALEDGYITSGQFLSRPEVKEDLEILRWLMELKILEYHCPVIEYVEHFYEKHIPYPESL